MKLVTTRFKSGGLHEKHVVATWNVGNHLSICLIDTGKPRKTCVEVAGRRTFRVLTSKVHKKKEKKNRKKLLMNKIVVGVKIFQSL